MLDQTIPAYLYQQYADDDDLGSFIEAYNAASQYYLDWFNDTPLAYYPGLSGDLLNWAAEGIYDMRRTSLTSPVVAAQGPFNTEPFNSAPFNSGTPQSQAIYSLSDDAFQRILTWNLYKGDGKRFSMRWIKRRIMRFLLGVSGLDPIPGTPGFVIGTENTQAISVTVASNVLTVSINQALLSSLVQISPGILQVFELAFAAGQSGPLELPAQYESFAVNVVTTLTATASPALFALAGSATTQNTGTSEVTVLGGSGAYSYSWSWLTGGSGLTISSPATQSTSFSGASMTPGNTYTGVAQCRITDTITLDTTTCTVSVSIQCYAALSASCSPNFLSAHGASSTESTGSTTVTISGGSGSYSVSWNWGSGGTGITINSPSSVTTSFTAVGMLPGASDSGVAICTVTDLVTAAQVTPACSVSISRATSVSASVSPTSQSSTGTATTQTTGASTVSASGGSGSYTYSWAWISGGANLSIGSPGSASTTFTGSGMVPGNVYTGTAQCTITDGYGQTTTVTVSVSITCQTIPAIYTGTITCGSYSFEPYTPDIFDGYYSGICGSASPGADTNAHTILALYTNLYSGVNQGLILQISGFSSNPGAGYISSLTVAGNTFAEGSATYAYSGGTASWTWSTSYLMPTSGTVAATIES